MTNWDKIGFVVASKYRIAALRQVSEKPCTPTTIARNEDMQISHVSRALKTLREKEIVELLVPEERKKGRIYAATEDGEKIWKNIINHEMETNTQSKNTATV